MGDKLNSENPQVREKTRLSAIWLLPIVALLIGLGIVYNSWQNRGIQVQVMFETAEGLEAGKTKIKNRNVDIGIVKDIRFNQDQSQIIVDIEIDKPMRNFLRNDSQFWVVRPRIGTDGVSGIGTLLSGAYIHISPGKTEIFATTFTGLEEPPVTSPTADGIKLTLVSSGGEPLRIGNPVIYRGFGVGRVESYKFNTATREAHYGVFIRAPYDALVTSNTFFWNAGGLSVKTSPEGVKFNIASLETLITGGVEFDIPDDLSLGEKITHSRTFTLYDSKESILERRKYDFLEYVVLVKDSVGGLYKGAPVEYRGIRVGTVHTPYMNFDQVNKIYGKENHSRIAVIIHIEPGRVSKEKSHLQEEFDEEFKKWIMQGLSASIERSNYITNSLKINLDYTGSALSKIEKFGKYTVIPSTYGSFASITEKVENILSMIEQLPLDKIANNTNQVIGSADVTLVTINQSLQELQKTLRGVQPDSPIYQSLEISMNKLQRTLDDIQPILKEVRNKPNSLIFGRTTGADVEPKLKDK